MTVFFSDIHFVIDHHFVVKILFFLVADFHLVEQNQIITTEWMAQGDL